MSESVFLSAVILVCSVMVVFNLFMVKRRGASGYLLACAFLALGTTLYAYQTGQSQSLVNFGALVVALLLAADFIYRTSKRQ